MFHPQFHEPTPQRKKPGLPGRPWIKSTGHCKSFSIAWFERKRFIWNLDEFSSWFEKVKRNIPKNKGFIRVLEGLADVQNKNCTLKLPSLKQTSHSPESSNGWKMISFFFEPRFFQGRTVSFRECTTATTKKGWGWNTKIAMFYVLWMISRDSIFQCKNMFFRSRTWNGHFCF